LIGLYDALRRAQQAIVANYMLEDRTGLSIDRVRVLATLAKSGPSIQIALVGRSGIDRSTLAVLVKAMASDGMLTLQRGANGDGRAITCSITKDGRKALRQAQRGLERAERIILARVSRADQVAAVGLLKAMTGVSQ
jgi:DNA-binding MarR family transcriptional regulator